MRWRWTWIFWRHILLVSLLALESCGGWPGLVDGTSRQQQRVDTLLITLNTAAPMRVNQRQDFTITLSDAEERPVTGTVYLDLVMTAHPMGANKPLAESIGPGIYRASSAFTMDGEWHVVVVAVVQGQEHRGTFLVTVLP